MKDYSGLSDFEINKLVAETLGNRNVTLPAECLSGSVVRYAVQRSSKKLNREGLIEVDTHEVRKDFCNNPSDAWPIIVTNGINIVNGKNYPDQPASANWRNYVDMLIQAAAQNPLRAAMEVYLMKRDAEKGHG